METNSAEGWRKAAADLRRDAHPFAQAIADSYEGRAFRLENQGCIPYWAEKIYEGGDHKGHIVACLEAMLEDLGRQDSRRRSYKEPK